MLPNAYKSYHVKQSAIDAIKTNLKTGDLIGNKNDNNITKSSENY